MLHLSFIYPEMLWLLALTVVLWAIALLAPRRTTLPRFWSMLAIRTLLFVLLVLSLAGAQLVFPVNALTTIFLIDGSDSMTPSARGRAETFVQQALEAMPDGDQAGIVVFGENALVEQAPGRFVRLGKLASVPVAAHTNIEEALRLGLALLPTDTRKRLVLLSDGGENDGRALTVGQTVSSRAIPIDVVDLSDRTAGEEVLVSHLEAPAHAHEDQTIDLVVTVESTVEQSARLFVFADRDLISDQVVHLVRGSNRFSFTTGAGEPGFRRYRAVIEPAPAQDGRVQNNEAAALVNVSGSPRLLLVEGTPGEARNLHDALQSASMAVETVAPDALPTNLTDLSRYEAVVLVNVAARALPVEAMTALPAYVRDLGKGLVMVGGLQSYGTGGYGHTPIEEALPVYMDVRDREERPNLAIIFVVDKSGSMDACHCSGPDGTTGVTTPSGDRKVDIAREAVIQASSLVGAHDTLGIVAFDRAAYQVFPPTTGPQPADVADAIARLEPMGNTNVRAGLVEAERMLATVDARLKHIVLLTDGWSGGGDNLDIAQHLTDQGVTLSVIAAGSGSADYLEQLASAGRGRYYPVEDMSRVPQIFMQETVIAAGNYLIERPFVPAVAADSTVLRGLEGLPVLYGHNGTTLKETARLVLASDEHLPVLAEWQYGLGRSIAWTSDLKGKWASDWVTWEHFPRFASQLVSWVFPTQSSSGLATELRVEGNQTTIVATFQETVGGTQEPVQVRARLLGTSATQPEGQAATLQDIPLMQVAPGTYQATIANPLPGTYLVQFVGQSEGTTVVQEMAGLVVPYSSEYRHDQSNPALLAELMRLTGGTALASPEASFAHNLAPVVRAQEIGLPLLVVALVLLPLDIGIRRLLVRWNWSNLGRIRSPIPIPSRPGRSARPPAPPDPTLERLAQAKQRARQRLRGNDPER
ncbi:MAG: VWA domain-containing protein [Chloroflexaceae bacterium]|nr:VWA domain-containing protein [Chloroflexaceae bacterium]